MHGIKETMVLKITNVEHWPKSACYMNRLKCKPEITHHAYVCPTLYKGDPLWLSLGNRTLKRCHEETAAYAFKSRGAHH